MENENETVKQVCDNMINFCTCGYLASLGNMEYFTNQILVAHERDIAAKDAEIEKLKFDNLHLKSCQRQSGEVIIEQTNKVEAKDAEIAKLRECLREAVEWSCGNPDDACGDCVAHGGDTPCKCEKWRKAMEVVK